MPNLSNVYRIKTLALTSQNGMFSYVMEECHRLYINDLLQLVIEDLSSNKILIDLTDIFLHNHLAFPDKEDKSLIYYKTNTCSDLTPLVKSISWKNSEIIISDPEHVITMLRNLEYHITNKNDPEAIYFYEINEDTINICSKFFGLKYQHDDANRLFLIYANRIIICNIDSIYLYDSPLAMSIEKAINSIHTIFGGQNEP